VEPLTREVPLLEWRCQGNLVFGLSVWIEGRRGLLSRLGITAGRKTRGELVQLRDYTNCSRLKEVSNLRSYCFLRWILPQQQENCRRGI